MGMDLVPLNDNLKNLHYNWEGWRWIRDFAEKNGISTQQFSDSNDGEELAASICSAMADVIEKHQGEYNQVFGGPHYGVDPAQIHARIWRESSGFEQW